MSSASSTRSGAPPEADPLSPSRACASPPPRLRVQIPQARPERTEAPVRRAAPAPGGQRRGPAPQLRPRCHLSPGASYGADARVPSEGRPLAAGPPSVPTPGDTTPFFSGRHPSSPCPLAPCPGPDPKSQDQNNAPPPPLPPQLWPLRMDFLSALNSPAFLMSHPVPACFPAGGRRPPRSRARAWRVRVPLRHPPPPLPSKLLAPPLGRASEPGAGEPLEEGPEPPQPRPQARPARDRGAGTDQYAERTLRAAEPARRRLRVLRARGQGQAPPRSQPSRERVRVRAPAAGEHQAPACQDVGGGSETCNQPGSS